ncbi:vomeronasal type-2 receptor 26-like [Rhinoderma darwinii]|uniref:vomeronasal type-2 receptor 26-like n=1 Tax=Rhinoderma darwinii TaxID=43563 RepID=UPI003F672E50
MAEIRQVQSPPVNLGDFTFGEDPAADDLSDKAERRRRRKALKAVDRGSDGGEIMRSPPAQQVPEIDGTAAARSSGGISAVARLAESRCPRSFANLVFNPVASSLASGSGRGDGVAVEGAGEEGGVIGSRKLHHYLGSQKDINGNRLFYENGDFAAQYSIVNWLILKNGSLVLIYVGSTNPIQNHSTFNINVERIFWKNNIKKVPKSQCSENCLPGTRKVSKSRIYSCCYDCVQCSPGEISNLTDSESCMKCTELNWPNEKKDRCVPRLLEFLSYTDDTIVLVICLVSIIFCFLTFMILVTFILYQDTAIVKANNRNLSFLLLVSIMLSFLCVFLFLGHPVDITCLLRQVSFGILFSVAVSCVLAKTVMVCIAFRATKPGSAWKRWIGSKWSNSLVLFCSSIQVMICMGWLTLAPPFPELDIHSYQGKIIVQCNEGSVIGFYSVLGYMGVLAAVSFITAFLARTLPDSFNEAKYITFSMLVFCSVWIAMIPAYLSTKGKYMVAVEIFAILTSSAGLLGCIFFPKCYIILWRPELNSRTHLLEGGTR